MKNGARFATRGGLGYIALDDAIEIYHFCPINENDYSEDEREKRIQFLEEMDYISSKYLNPKEKCIYHLVVHERKRTSDIAIILNYNGWRTTQNSIERVFKILNLYYIYENIDKSQLNDTIEANFSKIERKIIKLLNDRLTIQQISKKLGKRYHYTKTHSIIKKILNKLETLDQACMEYHYFLIEIRKFKDSCRFDESEDRVEYVD